MADDDSRYRAPALDKGLDILEVLAAQSEGLTRAELVRAMERSPSEIYRMLERLVARGYVTRTDGGDRYALSMKLFLLAHRHPPLRRLVAEAQPLMDEFARATGQSCHLVVPERRMGVVVAHATPESTWEFRVRIGAELDLFSTGSGLTLLAFQGEERRAETLSLWGLPGAVERLLRLEPHLAAVRAAGFREGPSAQIDPAAGLHRRHLALGSALAHVPEPGDLALADRHRLHLPVEARGISNASRVASRPPAPPSWWP